MYVNVKTMHEDFEQLLSSIGPTRIDVALIRAITMRLYNERVADKNREYTNKAQRINAIDVEIDKLFVNYKDARNPTIKSLCEQNIDRLTTEKEALRQELDNQPESLVSFEQALEAVLHVATSPLEIWKNSDLSLKRAVLNIYFPHKLSYSKAGKFRTPEIAPIFKFFSVFGGDKSHMVPVIGLEPTTPSLRMRCSTN